MKKTIKLGGLVLLVAVVATAGCSTTNLTKVIHELKADPATVEFQVMAPGWAVSFKRSWPTNLLVRPPASALQVNPFLPLPLSR